MAEDMNTYKFCPVCGGPLGAYARCPKGHGSFVKVVFRERRNYIEREVVVFYPRTEDE